MIRASIPFRLVAGDTAPGMTTAPGEENGP